MRTLMTLLALSAFAFFGTAHAGCVKAGGEATMVTEDLAKFMATAALNNQIKDGGFKPAGEAKMTCTSSLLGTHCIAQQRACK
ncbi:MAG: hypothetical protein NW205_02805 [Hyphomicrobiaceae bacterium]|nr:hypothetical protein [Hyphomicrobiaceae bacterium]